MAERTPENVGQEAGQAIADAIIDAMESSVLGLANAIRDLRDAEAETRRDFYALAQRVDVLERAARGRRDYLA